MEPINIIVAIFAIGMIFKGLALLFAKKDMERMIDDAYKKRNLKWISFTLGAIMMYYIVQSVSMLNILAILCTFAMISSGFFLSYPKEMKEISRKVLKIKGLRVVSAIAVIVGLIILYIAII